MAINELVLYDRTSTQNVIYTGTTASGTDTDAEAWTISETTLDENSQVVSIKWAEGLNAWSDRTTLEYN